MDVVTLGAALSGAKAYTDATIAPLLGGVHYRGSVNYFNNLPSNPAEGDAYTVKYSGSSGTNPDGTEYVWALDTDDNTYKWIGFSPDTYTKAEVDNLLSGKQDSIVFNTAYDATNNKAATMSDVPAAGSSTPQMDGTGSSGSATTYAKSDHVHPSDTSKQNEVLGSWTAGQATSHSTPAGTDTVLQALQKIDNNQRLDETNISLLSEQVGYAITALEGAL